MSQGLPGRPASSSAREALWPSAVCRAGSSHAFGPCWSWPRSRQSRLTPGSRRTCYSAVFPAAGSASLGNPPLAKRLQVAIDRRLTPRDGDGIDDRVQGDSRRRCRPRSGLVLIGWYWGAHRQAVDRSCIELELADRTFNGGFIDSIGRGWDWPKRARTTKN